MANNIAVSITADVADLQVKRAILSSELKAAQKDLNDFAKTARTSGATTELRTSMLGAADAAGKAKNSIALIDTEMKSLSGGAHLATGALSEVSHGSSTVTRELLVLAREAGRGNFTRMAGSATILAGALGFMTPEILTAAAGIVLLVAPLVAFEAAALSAAEDAAKFANAIQITGNYAGLTAGEFEAMAQRVATASNTGIGAARGALMSLVASGRFTSAEVEQLGRDATKFGELTGESAKKVIEGWVKMGDGPTRYAEEFNRTYHALTLAQLEHIANLEHEGQQSAATAALVEDLTHWLDNQAVHMGPLGEAWHNLSANIDGAWEALKRFSGGNQGSTTDQLGAVNAKIAQMRDPKYRAANFSGDAQGQQAYEKLLFFLERQSTDLAAKAAAEKRASDTTAENTRTQQAGAEAYQKSHETLLSLRSSAEAARQAVKDLHDEMAARLKANPNDAEAKDYQAHSGRYDAALLKKMDPGDHKKPKDTQVAVWREQLQSQLEAEKNYFSDSKTEELKFWTEKLALTTSGTADQRAVKTQIYNLDRELAQQTYREQVAALDNQLTAAKDNWAKEQAVMGAKLTYIRLNQGEQSTEYQAAQRQQEEQSQRHEQTLLEIQRSGMQEALAELKSNLDSQRQIREADARTAEVAVQSKPLNSGPIGKVSGDVQIAAMHQQMLAQQLAADQAYHAAQGQLLEAEIAAARRADGEQSKSYIEAVNAKKLADQQFANQSKVMSDQMVNTAQADAERIKSDWHAAIDPMVNVTAQGIRGLIAGTETWHQALMQIGGQAINMIIGAIEQMVEKWLVNMIVGSTATAMMGKSNVAAYAGVAGAAGVASMAGAPFPIDLAAPAFGADMAMAALAFGSFAVGTNMVPHDMIAQVHAGERIIPKADNTALMAAVSGGGGKGNSQTINNHYSPTIHTHGPADFEQALEDHGHVVLSMIKRAARDGKLKGLMA
jgi:phage-related minor tail protein